MSHGVNKKLRKRQHGKKCKNATGVQGADPIVWMKQEVYKHIQLIFKVWFTQGSYTRFTQVKNVMGNA